MLAHLKNYVRLKTMPCLMNTIYVHMSMVKHGTWYFKIHLPFANISWSIRIRKSCICSHISTSLLFPFFFAKKEKSEWAMLMAPGPAMLGSYRKLVHICDTIKRKTYLFNLWKQEKKLSEILPRQYNRKQGWKVKK